MKRIVFVGPPGSGKSTLAAEVFVALKRSGANVELVDEFVRRSIQLHGAMTSVWEQYRTRQYQKELEDAIPSNVDYVICDSGTLSPYFYATLYVKPTDVRQRLVLQDMYRYFLDDIFLKRYDLVFFVPASAGLIEDGTRYQTDDEINVLDQHMRLVFTRLHRIDNIVALETNFDQRLDEVMPKIVKEKA